MIGSTASAQQPAIASTGTKASPALTRLPAKPPVMRMLLNTEAVDFREGIDGLAQLCCGQSPPRAQQSASTPVGQHPQAIDPDAGLRLSRP